MFSDSVRMQVFAVYFSYCYLTYFFKFVVVVVIYLFVLPPVMYLCTDEWRSNCVILKITFSIKKKKKKTYLKSEHINYIVQWFFSLSFWLFF